MLGFFLGLTPGVGMNAPTRGPSVCDAIRDKKCITVDDDGTVLKLAPHIIYKRGKKETLALDAVLLERDSKPVNKPSLRRYPIEGLSGIAILDEGFAVDPDFDPDDPAYSGGAICVVQFV